MQRCEQQKDAVGYVVENLIKKYREKIKKVHWRWKKREGMVMNRQTDRQTDRQTEVINVRDKFKDIDMDIEIENYMIEINVIKKVEDVRGDEERILQKDKMTKKPMRTEMKGSKPF